MSSLASHQLSKQRRRQGRMNALFALQHRAFKGEL